MEMIEEIIGYFEHISRYGDVKGFQREETNGNYSIIVELKEVNLEIPMEQAIEYYKEE